MIENGSLSGNLGILGNDSEGEEFGCVWVTFDTLVGYSK